MDGEPVMMEPDTNPDAAFVVRLPRVSVGSKPPGAAEDNGYYYLAFGNACTHMGCILFDGKGSGSGCVQYTLDEEGKSHVVCGPCPCHGTSFDLIRGGLVILGPATQDLPRLNLKINNGKLVARTWLSGAKDPRAEQWPA